MKPYLEKPEAGIEKEVSELYEKPDDLVAAETHMECKGEKVSAWGARLWDFLAIRGCIPH
jgi:hypothetical protein